MYIYSVQIIQLFLFQDRLSLDLICYNFSSVYRMDLIQVPLYSLKQELSFGILFD